MLLEYEFFILPGSQVLPFDVNTHYPTEIAGEDEELHCLDEICLLLLRGREPRDVSPMCVFCQRPSDAAPRQQVVFLETRPYQGAAFPDTFRKFPVRSKVATPVNPMQ